MKVLFSIIFNALILYVIAFLLNTPWWEWVIIEWWKKTYIIWGIILWLINVTIRPVLKIVTLPLFFLFLWLVSFLINWIILKFFTEIIAILNIPWVVYDIKDWINLVIAVAIFTFLNMFYSTLTSKK